MTGGQEGGSGIGDLEEGTGELLRPPISTYERILNSRLRPHRIYNIEEVIGQAILLNESLCKYKYISNILSCSLIMVVLFIFVCYIIFCVFDED